MPIRWDNIGQTAGMYNAATFANKQASQQVNQGFDSLQSVLDTQQQAADANWMTGRDNNDTAVKSFINNLGAQGPEAMRQAMESGAVQDKIGSYGGYLSNDVREMTGQKALNQSTADWMTQDKYGDEVASNAAEPLINTLTNLSRQGPEGIAQAEAMAQDPKNKAITRCR